MCLKTVIIESLGTNISGNYRWDIVLPLSLRYMVMKSRQILLPLMLTHMIGIPPHISDVLFKMRLVCG